MDTGPVPPSGEFCLNEEQDEVELAQPIVDPAAIALDRTAGLADVDLDRATARTEGRPTAYRWFEWSRLGP